jgi:hypothetical protein
MRVVSKLQDDYVDQRLVVIYVDGRDKKEEEARYFDARRLDGNPFNGVKALANSDSLITPFQCDVAPMTIVIDSSGTIRDGWLKHASYEKFESSILPLVPKAPVKLERVVLISLAIVVLLLYFTYKSRHRGVVKR